MEKKKKRKKWWIPVLVVVFILFVLPIGLTFALFYTPGTEKIGYREDETVETLANNAIIDCLDNTATTKNLTVDLNQEDINTLVHGLMSKLPTEVNNFVDQVYCKIDGTKYTFKIEAHASFFKTSATLVTNLVDNGENVVFEIKDIMIGRLGLRGAVKNIAIKLDDETVNEAFANVGIHMKADLKNLKLTYPKKQLLDDIVALTMKNFSEDSSLFYVMFDSLLSNESSFAVQTNNSLGISISIAQCETNENYCTPEKLTDYTSQTNEAVETLESWIDNKNVAVQDIDTGFNYLIYGYDALSSEQKATVDSFTLPASWGNKEDYDGFGMVNSKSINEMMIDTINTKSAVDVISGELCLLTEDEINAFLKSQKLIGTSYLLHRNTSDGYKISYVMVDNFYCNLVDDHAYFVIDINFNGLKTSLIFDAEVFSTSDKKLVFKASGDFTYYGTKKVASNLIDYVFDLLGKTTDSETMIVDSENKAIAFDFNEVVNSADIKPEVKVIINSSTGLELTALSGLPAEASNIDKLNADGYIKLKLTF